MTKINEIEELFKAHYAAMHRLAMLLLRDEDTAKDIVHDVFETVLSAGAPTVSGPYLLKAVRNRCLNHMRDLSTRQRLKKLYSLDETEIAEDQWPDDSTIALIQSAVAQSLTPACRRVVRLRFADGKSYKEIAACLGISEVAVYKHLRHAIDVLRLKLSQNG